MQLLCEHIKGTIEKQAELHSPGFEPRILETVAKCVLVDPGSRFLV